MVSIGVIGIGKMGKNHARVYSEMRGVDKLYLYDINREALSTYITKVDAYTATSIGEICRNCDGVSICTPTETHLDVVKSVMKEGPIPMLIEKPVASNLIEGAEIENMVDQAGIIAGVGHIERFNPAVTELRKIPLVHPKYIEVKRHNPDSSRVLVGSVVEDLMIHDIDVIRSVFIPEKHFRNFQVKYAKGDGDVMMATAEVTGYPEQPIPVFLSASRVAMKRTRTLYIEDMEKTIELDYFQQTITIYRKPERYEFTEGRFVTEGIVENIMVNKAEPLKTELTTFISCIRDKKPFPVTVRDGLDNLRICMGISKAASRDLK